MNLSPSKPSQDILSLAALPKINNLRKFLLIRLLILIIILILKPDLVNTMLIITGIIAGSMLYEDTKRNKVTPAKKIIKSLLQLNLIVGTFYYIIFFSTYHLGSKGIYIAAILIGAFYILRNWKMFKTTTSSIAQMMLMLKEDKKK